MTKSTESTCKHCHQPIQLISTHKLDPGQWYHLDGHHAHRECRNVLAEPVDERGVGELQEPKGTAKGSPTPPTAESRLSAAEELRQVLDTPDSPWMVGETMSRAEFMDKLIPRNPDD